MRFIFIAAIGFVTFGLLLPNDADAETVNIYSFNPISGLRDFSSIQRYDISEQGFRTVITPISVWGVKDYSRAMAIDGIDTYTDLDLKHDIEDAVHDAINQ